MMSVASCDQLFGTSASFISKTTRPSASVMRLRRLSHSTVSKTSRPGVVNRRVIFMRSLVPFPRSIDPGERQTRLVLVLAALVRIADGADAVGLQKDDLRDAFVGVDLGRKRRGVGDFQRDAAAPLRLERRYVDDYPAARIR